MIIVQAKMWPHGNESGAYELLNVSLSNRSSPGDLLDSYMCHVIARPKPFDGIIGYEADVAVKCHNARDGFAPLLMSVLGAAYNRDPLQPGPLPPAQRLTRLDIMDAHQFEALLRKGVQ